MVVKFKVIFEDKISEWRFIDKIDRVDIQEPCEDNDNLLTFTLKTHQDKIIEEIEVSNNPSSFDDKLECCYLRSNEIYLMNDQGQTIEKISP